MNLTYCLFVNLDHQYIDNFSQAASSSHGHTKQEIEDDAYESIGLCLHTVDTSLLTTTVLWPFVQDYTVFHKIGTPLYFLNNFFKC